MVNDKIILLKIIFIYHYLTHYLIKLIIAQEKVNFYVHTVVVKIISTACKS